MKTQFLLILSVFIQFAAIAQTTDRYANSYVCKNGKIHFFSSTPLEDIEATSEKAVCSFNTETQKVYARVSMTSFEFPKKLMEEHFNENYMESEQYPYGILDGVVSGVADYSKDGVYDIVIKGTFEVHGVKVQREIKGKLTIKNGAPVKATAKFEVKLVDHKIKIPKAVVMNIAETIMVDVDFDLEKYQKS